MFIPAVTLAISSLCVFLAISSALATALTTRSSSISTSLASTTFGSILIDTIEPSHLAPALTAPPPAVPSTSRAARSSWTRCICSCIFCACFRNLPNPAMVFLLLSHFDDRSLKNLQRFLRWLRVLTLCIASRLGQCGRNGFADLQFQRHVFMQLLLEFALQQFNVTGPVHKFAPVSELWIESDRQHVPLHPQRSRANQVRPRQRCHFAQVLYGIFPSVFDRCCSSARLRCVGDPSHRAVARRRASTRRRDGGYYTVGRSRLQLVQFLQHTFNADHLAGLDRLNQRDLEQNSLRECVAQPAFG